MNARRSAEFITALLDAQESSLTGFAPGANTAARFAVHRHTCRSGLINALRTAYPSVVTAVGNTYFDALAAEFIQASPPSSPVLQEYSPAFPDFVGHFPPLAEWPWLSDVARIDWARREAFHAADADALSAAHFQSWPLEALMRASLRLHPSLHTLASSYPAWSLWHCQQSSGESLAEDGWRAESLQVWRIGSGVQMRLLRAGEVTLRRGLADGLTLVDALRAACALDLEFDASTALATLIGDGLIVAVTRQSQ